MLTRMYNLSMHTNLSVYDLPWKWVVGWSRMLEADLTQRRLHAAQQARKRKPR